MIVTLRATPARAEAMVTAVVAIATALMLESTRVFLSYTVFVVDQSERVQLAAIAIALFAAFGLAPLLVRALGPRWAVVACGCGLGLSRLILQFWDSPEARIFLGAAGLLCWGWLLVPILVIQREAAAFGVGLGLGVDVAIRIAFLTVDLPFMPGASEDLVSVALVLTLVVVIAYVARSGSFGDATGSGTWIAQSVVALGPGIAMFHLVTGNLGLAQVKIDGDFPEAVAALAAGLGIGIVLSGLLPRYVRRVPGRPRLIRLLLVGAGALGLFLFWQEGSASWLGLVVGAALMTVVLIDGLRQGAPDSSGHGATALWLTVGMLVQVAVLFAYFTFTGSPVLVVVAVGTVALAVSLNGSARPIEARPSRPVMGLASAVVGLLILVCGWRLLSWSEPDAGGPLPSDFTVVNYNVQTGFSRDNHWDLEATARTIEAQDPDVVILQEVSRGWLITSGVDEVLWLSDRLDMPATFGASSGDGLWGNVILTRAPVLSTEIHQYASTRNLERSAVAVEVQTESGSLWVVGTHLDNPSGAGEIRLEQVGQLISFWNGRGPAIIAGDFNATPDTDVLAALLAAGLSDPGAALGPDAFTSQNGNRIDYILVTDGTTAREIRIPDVWTSDHKPVVADLTLR